MSWKKVKDLVVVVGFYEKDGEEKKRYKNVGIILQDGDDQDRQMIMLDRSFNPAGIPFDEDRPERIVINSFDPKDDAEKPQRQAPAQSAPAPAQRREPEPASSQPPMDDFEDGDIPF